MKNLLKIMAIIVFVGVLVGCTESENNNVYEQTNEQNVPVNQSEEFIPTKSLPEGIPIYPEATLTGEINVVENNWQWLYETTGSGNEIMTYFVNSLKELGFGIDNNATIAINEEFFVVTDDETIKIYWLDSQSIADVDQVTPDTPNRHYSIIVDLEKWENR